MNNYDVIIVGAGPAGLSAALYSARALLKTAVFEKATVGGLITQTSEIENYPGSEFGSTGFSLTQKMYKQAEEAGAEFVYEQISSVVKSGELFELTTTFGNTFSSKTVIICGGTLPRLLGVSGESEMRGRGVSYCATCDAGFFKNRKVAVVGGGDTAVKEAEYLTKFASEVILIHRRDSLRAAKILSDKIEKNDKISVMYNTVLEKINGKMFVESLSLKNTITGEITELGVDGIFIFAGYIPNTEIYKDLIDIDSNGYIITTADMHTSLDGMFAAGDIRNTVLRQVITAASDGAIAAVEAEKYISDREW